MSGGVSSSAAAIIPAGSRKMVQSLKEIVSCSEQEIYAMLKECNMDPNETVDRLLSLGGDGFHEVKRKREKKKENKDTTDSRSRGAGNNSNRGGRGGTYVGRGGPSHYASTETGALHGKSAYKKENGTQAHPNSSYPAPRMPGNNMNHKPLSWSDSSVLNENKSSTMEAGYDSTYSSSQPSGFQPAWGGVPGQVSMADIVKRGRPSNTVNQPHRNAHDHLMTPSSASLHQDWPAQGYTSNLSEEPGVVSIRHVPPTDDWPVEQSPVVIDGHSDSNHYPDSSNLPFDRTNKNLEFQIEEVQVQEDGTGESSNANFVQSGSTSSRSALEDDLGSASQYDNDMYHNMNSYQPHRQTFQHHEVEDGGESVSAVAANLHELSLRKDEQGPSPEEDDHSVVIPNHLQVQSADCSHLSFGSFGPVTSTDFSAPLTSRSVKSNVEEASPIAVSSSVGRSDTRNPDYYQDDHFITSSNENLVHRASASESYDSHSASQSEIVKQDTPETGQGNQYAFSTPVPNYTFENSQQLNTAYAHSSSQMLNNTPFSSVLQGYTNPLPSTLLASTVQPVRESDYAYSPFSVSQSMPTKYNNAVSSISGSTISMHEGLKTGDHSSSQTTQEMPSGNVATGPGLPQHLAMHPYSQPTLPLGHYANMIGYPFMPPQSYAYMPSAYQQAFGGNSSYHQSLAAAMLPQYKNSVSGGSLSQSAAIASGYGAYGSSTNVPGNFPVNPPAAGGATGTNMGYDDIINSQYKDASQLLSLQQQSDNSGMWVHGPGSRTMSGVPASTYYSFQQGQNQQQSAGFRQAQQQQQPSQQSQQHYGLPNYYHSQTGISSEHQHQQQQNLRDVSLSGSQGQQPSKQSQQMWQNNY